MEKKNFLCIKSIIYLLGILIIAFLSSFIIKDYIDIPSGSDIYGHLFRSNVLYNSILEGDLYPIYTNLWYNGTELFRTWPPLTYYLISFLMFFTNGSVLNAYYLFIIVCFVLSSFGFLLFGIKEKRISLCFILSIFYFFLPDNLRVLMSEGNVSRIFITAIIPYLFFFVNEFLIYKKKYALFFISIIIAIITFAHFMIAAMCGISLFILCIFHFILMKDFKGCLIVLINTILSYLLASIVLIPGLLGGMMGLGSSADAELAMWTEDFKISMNPFLRFTSGDGLDAFYFSIVLILFLILAIICYRKKNFPFFISSLIIFLLSSSELIPLLKMLPFSQVFWMKRLAPIAYLFAFIGIIYWKDLKKTIFTFLLIFLLIDIVPSLGYFYYNQNNEGFYNDNKISNMLDDKANDYLLNDAINLVDNKIAIIDESLFGSLPSYYLSRNVDEGVEFINGWGLQGARARDLIVHINEAYKNKYFYYVFDRLIEIGADTVIFNKNLITEDFYEELKEAGKILNYDFIKESEVAFLFKLNNDFEGTYGTISENKYLSIGESAIYIQYLYPSFVQGFSNCLDDYTLDDLVKYEKIYLSGFTYNNKEKVEELINEVSSYGTKVYIDMNNIPEDKVNGRNSFLDVYAQPITFTDKFPILKVGDYEFKLQFESDRYESWRACYLTGMDNIKKSAPYLTYPELAYWGTNENGNVHFLGFNLIYYCVENKDDNLLLFFDEVFDVELDATPKRNLVPIEINYNIKGNKITINSNNDNVNTNLSYLDCFSSFRELKSEDNLMIVNKGETIIDINYPMFNLGIIGTCIGIISLIIFWIFVYFKDRDKVELKNT